MSYAYDTTHDSPNYTPAAQAVAVFGQARVIQGITIHWWGDPAQNPSFEGVRDYLCRPNGNTSAHFVATGTNRQVACIVAPGDIAWHTGSARGNAITIGIECDPRCRDEDYDVIAELVADIRSAYGDVPIYSHNMWIQTTCPGNYDINRIDQLSYAKFSAPVAWGQGGDKNPKAPVAAPEPVPVVVAPMPAAPDSPTATPPEQGGGLPVMDKPPVVEPTPAPVVVEQTPVPPVVIPVEHTPTVHRVSFLEAIIGLIRQFLTMMR